MDYSPYRRQSRRGTKSGAGIFLVFLASSIIGFLLIWGLKSLFFSESGTTVLPKIKANNSSVSVMLNGLTTWSKISKDEEGRVLAEGDRIKSTKGESATLLFENGTAAYLGLGSELAIEKSRKNDDNELYGKVEVISQPVIFSFEGNFDTAEEFTVWASKKVYVRAKTGQKVFLTNNAISLLEGESITAFKTNEDGKIIDEKSIGIGQSLNTDKFLLQAIPESLKHRPLYLQYSGETPSEPAPSEEKNTDDEENKEAQNPIITAPTIQTPNAGGQIVSVTSVPQTLSGNAPENAKKIIVEWESPTGKIDTYTLKSFTSGTWKYIASPNYNTIAAGKNTYRVYAVDKNGQKSAPATLVMEYKKTGTTENVFTDSEGNLVITSPNLGKNTVQSSRTIQLRGTAPSNAQYITVVNSTLGSAYTLTKYVPGSRRWFYATGEMNNGSYTFVVKAQNASRATISSDSITVTVGTTATNTSTPVPSATAIATPAPTVTATPAPTSTSTSEVAR